MRLADHLDIMRAEIVAPVSALGPAPEYVRQIAQRHPWFSWNCPDCGQEVPVTTRSELALLRGKTRLAQYHRCSACSQALQDGRQGAWLAESSARQERVRHLATMPYQDYLRTPEWQERRKAALKRAGYRCMVCNRSRVLHVHHRTYERRGDELARDLIVLCDECHGLYHGKGLLADHADAG
jgi:5-methylcytosine-specific restriction endonuclease McrA